MVKLLCAMALLAGSASAVQLGGCRTKPPAVKTFDASQFVGNWYEIYRSSDIAFETGICNTASYAATGENEISITNNEYVNGAQSQALGTALCSKLGDARCHASFNWLDATHGSNYWVTSTDYTNYAVIYSCTEYLSGVLSSEYYWIFSRSSSMSSADKITSLNLVSNYGYDVTMLQSTTQGGSCVYYI